MKRALGTELAGADVEMLVIRLDRPSLNLVSAMNLVCSETPEPSSCFQFRCEQALASGEVDCGADDDQTRQ